MNFQEALAETELTQNEIAERMGVSGPLVSHWKTGRREPNAAQGALLIEILQTASHKPAKRVRNQYPSAPLTLKARRDWVTARTLAFQNMPASAYNPSGIEGKGARSKKEED